MDSLFLYLYAPEALERMKSLSYVPPRKLSHSESALLQSKLMRLNFIPVSQKKTTRTHLRVLLVEILHDFFSDTLLSSETSDRYPSPLPLWMQRSLEEVKELPHMADGLSFIVGHTGLTKEHICRSFKKFLGMTPVRYITMLRLNYVANMLLHSDGKIVNIAMDAGFESLSYFYHLFQKEYGTTPLTYRKLHREKGAGPDIGL